MQMLASLSSGMKIGPKEASSCLLASSPGQASDLSLKEPVRSVSRNQSGVSFASWAATAATKDTMAGISLVILPRVVWTVVCCVPLASSHREVSATVRSSPFILGLCRPAITHRALQPVPPHHTATLPYTPHTSQQWTDDCYLVEIDQVLHLKLPINVGWHQDTSLQLSGFVQGLLCAPIHSEYKSVENRNWNINLALSQSLIYEAIEKLLP